MKEYCRRDTFSSYMIDDPKRGLVIGKEEPTQHKGFKENGNTLLSNRFDPNNVELNKKRFQNQHKNIMNVSSKRGVKFTKELSTDLIE